MCLLLLRVATRSNVSFIKNLPPLELWTDAGLAVDTKKKLNTDAVTLVLATVP